MSALAFDTFLHEALSLPREQRSQLATRLLASLEEDDIEISPAWKAEVNRRAGELDSGEVNPMSLEAFKDHLESRVNA